MTCSNCTRDIADGSEFCPYCGSKQAPGIEETARKLGATAAGFAQSAMGGVKEAWEASGPSPQHQQRQQERRGMPGAVVMTGSPVMSFSGIEVVMGAGQTPPMVVADEQTVHLAHTTRRLTPDELLARVQGVLAADEVPVDVRIVEAQWRSDGSERRPRLMAQLRDHAYQDIRMMLGVDYLGRWASVQMMLAVQPDPTKSWSAPMWTFIAMLFGALFGLGGVAAISDGQGVGFIGVLIGLVVFFVGYSGYKGSKVCTTRSRPPTRLRRPPHAWRATTRWTICGCSARRWRWCSRPSWTTS